MAPGRPRSALAALSWAAVLASADARAAAAAAEAVAPPTTVLTAYAEAFAQWNFARPSNGITNFRGFDDRHSTLSLSNAAIDLSFTSGLASGRVALQTGTGPTSYYLAEPVRPGTASVATSDVEVWRLLQQAYAGVKLPDARVLVEAGLFLSPVGPESLAIKDSWAWSRSTLFFALPFYHAEARASFAATPTWTLVAAISNGWNSAVDNNEDKSLRAQALYARDTTLVASVLYLGGVERSEAAPEGQPWRHLLDAHVTWQATPRLALQLHGDAGFEDGRLGFDGWVAGAAAARVRIRDTVFVAARGDVVAEDAPAGSSVLLPVEWVASGTLTLDVRPTPAASVRLEYRHDHAGSDLYFGGTVAGDGTTTPWVPSRESQDTVTIGLVTWL